MQTSERQTLGEEHRVLQSLHNGFRKICWKLGALKLFRSSKMCCIQGLDDVSREKILGKHSHCSPLNYLNKPQSCLRQGTMVLILVWLKLIANFPLTSVVVGSGPTKIMLKVAQFLCTAQKNNHTHELFPPHTIYKSQFLSLSISLTPQTGCYLTLLFLEKRFQHLMVYICFLSLCQ